MPSKYHPIPFNQNNKNGHWNEENGFVTKTLRDATEPMTGSVTLAMCDLYLSGGQRGRTAVSSVILAVGPIVDGVTPAIPSKRLNMLQTRNRCASTWWNSSACFKVINLPHTASRTTKAKTFPEKLRQIFRKLSCYLEQMLMEKRKQTRGGSSIQAVQRACDMTLPLLSSSTRAVGGNFDIWCFKETHHRCLAPAKWKPILKCSLVISSNQGRRCNMQRATLADNKQLWRTR